MDDDDLAPPKKRGKNSLQMWAFVVVLVVGIAIGMYFAPVVGPLVLPDNYKTTQEAQALHTQNQLLKERLDCLTNAIQQNRGKAGLTECI